MAMSTGIDTYIIKVASLCNLNCSYCYYYNGADTSYKGRPKLMSSDIIQTAVGKIIAHTQKHNIAMVDLTLHGGEPLLMEKSFFLDMMHEFDRIDRAGIATRRKCQTNAVLIDEEWIDLFTRWNILLGVSMDGPKVVHDKFRVDHAGKGSYEKTVRGLRLALANETEGLKTSVISVINPEHSGADMFHHLRSLGVKKMDFLLPESNYAYPPQGYTPLGDCTPYGDFLIEVFDAWITEDDPEVTVRLLDRIIRSVLSYEVKSDVVGGAPIRVGVIETDGALEPTDNIKVCADRITDLGLNIFHNTFDELYYHPFFKHFIELAQNIPQDCSGCKYIKQCAGGRISTRFSKEKQFANRTIYCNDLYKVYDYVKKRISDMMDE